MLPRRRCVRAVLPLLHAWNTVVSRVKSWADRSPGGESTADACTQPHHTLASMRTSISTSDSVVTSDPRALSELVRCALALLRARLPSIGQSDHQPHRSHFIGQSAREPRGRPSVATSVDRVKRPDIPGRIMLTGKGLSSCKHAPNPPSLHLSGRLGETLRPRPDCVQDPEDTPKLRNRGSLAGRCTSHQLGKMPGSQPPALQGLRGLPASPPTRVPHCAQAERDALPISSCSRLR